jgi:secondary thiamine-phosphate synthase enzyme
MERLQIQTKKAKQIVDITDEVHRLLKKSGAKNGLCHLFVLHTTAALATADLDPGTDLDMLDAFEAIAPRLKYRHPHDPSHVTDHILSTLIGASLLAPVENGDFVLGTWQRIVLVEFSGPRKREVVVTFLKE